MSGGPFEDFPTEEVVEVDWVDAYGGSGWVQKTDLLNGDRHPASNRSVGYVLRRTKDFIDLAQSRSKSDSTDNRISIPINRITKVHILQPKRSGK